MVDKNGTEIQTGDIVEVSGAYFKNDNGLFFVTASPGDPGWSGDDHCLHKIGKTGKVSAAKYDTSFWPLFITVGDWRKRAAAQEWNHKHATIEVTRVDNMGGVRQYFRERADNLAERIREDAWNFGENAESVAQLRTMLCHCGAVLDRIQ